MVTLHSGSLTSQERQSILNKVKLAAGTTAALVGGDVNAAANAADVAVKNNGLTLGMSDDLKKIRLESYGKTIPEIQEKLKKPNMIAIVV